MSKSSPTMTQCMLIRHVDKSKDQVDTRWIETRLAVKGQKIQVKATGDIWHILEVYATWPTDRVLAYEKDYVAMATVTDAFHEVDPKTGKKRRKYPKKQTQEK